MNAEQPSAETSEASASSRWPKLIRLMIVALCFLSIFPVPRSIELRPDTFARTPAVFPLIGALIGAFLVGIGVLSGFFWNDVVCAVWIVVAGGVLTGGLQLDGLGDTFDGVMSWRPRERKLEIMRDSRIGVMGALALIAVLALKIVLLASAAQRWTTAIPVAAILGRWAMSYAIRRFPSARPEGIGTSYHELGRPIDLLIATLFALVLSFGIAGVAGLVALLLVGLAVELLARWWTQSLGGLTGDTYGALCELGEVIALAALTAHL